MVTRIQQWGNSQGVRLSRQVLAEAGMGVGEQVDVSVHDGVVVLTPARRVRGGVTLEDLLERIPDDYEPSKVEWGPPAGGEVW
jgi:antitoxin MazE